MALAVDSVIVARAKEHYLLVHWQREKASSEVAKGIKVFILEMKLVFRDLGRCHLLLGRNLPGQFHFRSPPGVQFQESGGALFS